MTRRQAIWIAVSGGSVVYHNHLYNIRNINEAKCTLISLPYEWLVLNVPLSEITAEEDYYFNNADR